MIELVFSGAQIGADIAGLRAAKRAGIPTGGWVTDGCRTSEGKRPDLIQRFDLKECESSDYAFRTRLNVQHTDGTMRFATSWQSPGERATLREIKRFNKPYLDIDPSNVAYAYLDLEIERAIHWIWSNDIVILNVAGNGRYDIEPFVEMFLGKLFEQLKNG